MSNLGVFTKKKFILLFSFIVFAKTIVPLSAEAKFGGVLDLYNGFFSLSETNINDISGISYLASGYGRLSLYGSSENVKGQLSIEGRLGTSYSSFDIYRAYVRMRFDWFRYSIGKNALSISDGFYYNAGDIIFGSTPQNTTNSSFSSLDFRDNSRWYNSFQFYINRFTFVEMFVFAPAFTLTDLISQQFPDIRESGIGARIVGKVDLVKLETGYFFEGKGGTQDVLGVRANVYNIHRLYVNTQFPLYFDWNISASLELPNDNPSVENLVNGLQTSLGMFKIFELDNQGRTLSLRLEALFRIGMPFTARYNVTDGAETRYGTEVFLQLGFGISDGLTLNFFTLFSPIDLSAFLNAGVSWNVYQGLTLYSSIGLQLGEDESDVYYLYRNGGINMIVGVKYNF